MDFLIKSFHILMRIISFITVILADYYLFLSLFSFYQKKRPAKESGRRRFAIVIPAHNERNVVAEGIKSCHVMDYPRELYDIYVIADNCSDDTAEIARNAGAKVFERRDPDRGGKGFALNWFFEKLLKMEQEYRSVVILDADNLVSKNFLEVLNKKMNQGYQVVQCYLDSKNPFDTAISAFNSVEFWISNRSLKLSRDNLGLSAQLGGTGFAVDTEILKHYGWDATCLTEDLEFTCKLNLNGIKVGWEHDAAIYDEKPLTMKASWRQRKRWMQGYADVFTRYFFPLVKKGIRTGNFAMIDCAIYSIQPILLIMMSAVMIYNYGIRISNFDLDALTSSLTILNYHLTWPEVFLGLASLGQILFSPFIMWFDKKLSFKGILTYLFYPLYTVTWLPIAIQGIMDKDKKTWVHTEHTRAVSVDELEDSKVK